MATPVGQFRPLRLIMIFVVITIGLYSLVFFTAGSNSPKLGIDLQGGTRITLTAHSADNAVPAREAMNQARDVMERRVNGSGVAGAQVQVEGTSQLVVTVPGTQDLTDLTRSAQLNLRPQIGSAVPQATVSTTTTSPTAVGTGSETSGATETAPTAATSAPAATTAGTPEATTTASATAAETTPASSQGLRAPNAAARDTTPAGTEAAATDPSTIQATSAADTAGTVTATPTDASGTGTAATTTAAPATFPSSSSPTNPTQPASANATDWTTWETDIQSSMAAGLTCAQIAPYDGLDDPAKPVIGCDTDNTAMYLLDKTLISGDQVSNAVSQYDTSRGWAVLLTFKSQGFTDWATYTAANIGKNVAFVLDGRVITSPTIQSAITTDTSITGSFTQATSTALANSLKFGALPLAFERSSSDSVSAELGLSYLRAGIIAGGVGLLLVIIYCLIYYRLLGVITILSLLLSFGLVYAVMVLLGRWIGLSLDMPGIAGLIIAIGITADSFVVYFERIKDEVREGRTFRSAVPRGWIRARRTILSADAVSFLAAAVLYVLAVGDVRGFAFTLGLSTVLDLVVVFMVTHPLVAEASGSKIFSSPRWSGLGAVADAGMVQRASVSALSVKGS